MRPFRLRVSVLALGLSMPAIAQTYSRFLRVDAFGYLPNSTKVVVLRDPVVGWDASQSYSPGPRIEIRRVADNSVAWSGAPVPWRGGVVHSASGDRCYLADFSALTETGAFYAIDPARNQRTEPFEVRVDAYRHALRAAVRMYYYQRCGVAKTAQHGGAAWADAKCHHGTEQDLDCRAVGNPVPSTSLDLSGGWHDAGDYNKYVNSADGPVHDLLFAYEARPDGWTDDLGLPESGNGIPDLLDEVRFELEWLLKMQRPDGSLLHKVSVTDFAAASPASADAAPRRYAPETASATISGAGAFAHAAIVFGQLPQPSAQAFARRLRAAALAAWTWLDRNPNRIPSRYDNAGFQSADMEDPPYEQSVNRLCAAVFLYELTNDARYRTFFDSGYRVAHLLQWSWASPYETTFVECYLRYTWLDNATRSVSDAIRSAVRVSLRGSAHHQRIRNGDDPYGSAIGDDDFTWGSNKVLSSEGVLYGLANRYGVDPQYAREYFEAGAAYLHRLHGVNPGGHTYLTNMSQLGAEGSVDEMYHGWFGDGTVWDNAKASRFGPPPGFLTGGVNKNYAPDGSYGGPPIQPPQNQPPAKAYRDWNTSWPENSWSVTECHIPYQGMYIRLLADLALPTPPARLGMRVDRDTSNGGRSMAVTMGGAQANEWIAIFFANRPGRFALDLQPIWCMNLGLELSARPDLNVLFLGRADMSGQLALRFDVPAVVPLYPWRFQATQAGRCPIGVQSAVVR